MDRGLWKAVTDSGRYDDYVFLDYDSFVDFVEATDGFEVTSAQEEHEAGIFLSKDDGDVTETVLFEKVTIIGGL